MYENNASLFLEGQRILHDLSILVRDASIKGVPDTLPMEKPVRDVVAMVLEDADRLFDKMGAISTRDAVRRFRNHIRANPMSNREIDLSVANLRGAFFDEMKTWHVLFLNEKEAAIFDHGETTTFGQQVINAFPTALPNMIEACKCFALNRWTATTYHCMGVLEVGIRALCKELQVTIDLDLPDTTWNKMQNAITARLTPQGSSGIPRKASHPATWPDDEIFFNEALQDIRMLSKAYRNPAMHFRSINAASDGQARRVLEGTAGFMRSLSEKVSEAP